MSWLKMGRWVVVGALGMCCAAACGGRGNLPIGDGFDGDSGSAGALSFGGVSSFGGASATAGSAVGGSGTVGGSSVTGGSTGAAGTATGGADCGPNSGKCQGMAISFCDANGGSVLMACGKGQTCVETPAGARCVKQVCTPGEVQCDAGGQTLQVCAPDGASFQPKVSCAAQGQRCRDGACRSLACEPNQKFCDKAGVRLCNADGSASKAVEDCDAGEFCDPKALTCKKGVCAPGQPACNGSVATTCNANGSGYVGPGVDCGQQLDRQCVQGACLCSPSTADCDGFANNGCETNVTTDADNCGGCDLVCSSSHMATRTCDDSCNGVCKNGFLDCNGDKLSDGCEVNQNTDSKNCGACGLTCSNNHVTPHCGQGDCDGTCSKSFADCNGNKQVDGCESDSRSDAKNCGGCGVVCSSNHVKAVCAASTCSGDCANGFADCNGNKQSDGCEINTQNDANNCSACGNACPGGQSCVGGKCSALLTFSGVAQDLPVAALTGWTQCYSEAYGAIATTSITKLQQACKGSLLMMACRPKGSATLQLAALAPRADVLFDTGNSPTAVHSANGVAWYFNNSFSWGFAPQGDPVLRNSCDTQDSTIAPGGVDGDKRLCWHTGGDFVQGGWRCGRNDSLNDSQTFERLMFSAP